MEDEDIVDVVNALLKLDVGDAYRLEHIKQSYIQNKSIWITDKNYLEQMKEKYLIKHSNLETYSDEALGEESEKEEKIHCWKCGKKSTLGANFCMICGASLFEVASNSTEQEPISPNQKIKTKSIGLKTPIIIGIPVLILVIIGGAYSQGYFDNAFEKNEIQEIEKIDTEPNTIESTKVIASGETNSKCGTGTVFDPETNACVLENLASTTKTVSSGETNSKCGTGTVFDPETNACVLDK